MNPLDKLAEYFGEFPGIGPRQAKRFVYFLLTRNTSYINGITELINEIKNSVTICKSCYRFFQNNKENNSLCNICSSLNRDKEKLMILARDVDFETIEKSKAYNGLYFILGGTIPILDKEPEKRVRLRELIKRIDDNVKEIIISMNSTADGENTGDYLKQYIKEKLPERNIKLTTLGRGLSTGSELEYLDSDTIKNALENRKG
jgi:recombination protein RecR